MSSVSLNANCAKYAAYGAFLLSLGVAAPGNADTHMTAGSILEKMNADERFAYINGIVEGMAYSRFRKDTIAAGSKTETGLTCIYGWYYKGDGTTHARIEATFRKYPDQMPATVIAAMIKKECGE